MFHPSESIIITSKSKSGDSDSSLEKPRGIRSRQRASTWSSPSSKDDPSNSNSPKDEKRKFRKRFGISRKGIGGGNIATLNGISPNSATTPFSYTFPNQPQKKYPPFLRHSSSAELFREDEKPEVTAAPPYPLSDDFNDGSIRWVASPDSSGPDFDSISKTDSNSKKNITHDTSSQETSETPSKLTSSNDQVDKDTSDVLRNNSTSVISRTSPSTCNDRQQNNHEEPIYPPNHTNISSKRIGILSHEYGDYDINEEEKYSIDHDEEYQPSKMMRGCNVDNSNIDPVDTVNTSNSAFGRESHKDDDESYYNDESERNHNYYSNSSWSQSMNVIQSDYDYDQDSDDEHMQQSDYTSEGSTEKKKSRFKIPKPNWSRIATAVVRRAPCFWCCATVEISSTDRVILTKLNRLCTIFALYQILCGAAYTIVLLSQKVADRALGNEEVGFYREALTPNLWMPSGSILWIAIVGFVVLITMISTVQSIRSVNLQGALRYMWVLYWIIPFQVIAVLSFIDVQRVTDVWIKHWWSSRSMAGFRRLLCDPDLMCECAAPASVLLSDDILIEKATEATWCDEQCNATGTTCKNARTDATTLMSAYSYIAFTASAIVGLVLVALLMLALFLLQRIISEPIVKSSKEYNIPLWLTFPTILSFLGGTLFLTSPQTRRKDYDSEGVDLDVTNKVNVHGTKHYLIGVFYMVSGSLFLGSAILGWFIRGTTVLDGRDKTRKKIAVYLFIGMMALTIFAVASILVYSLIYSSNIVPSNFSDDERGTLACFYGAWSCSNCNATELQLIRNNQTEYKDAQICPEWDIADVLKIEQTIMKQSAAFASIFVMYAFTALRFGFTLKTLVSRYEVDYV